MATNQFSAKKWAMLGSYIGNSAKGRDVVRLLEFLSGRCWVRPALILQHIPTIYIFDCDGLAYGIHKSLTNSRKMYIFCVLYESNSIRKLTGKIDL